MLQRSSGPSKPRIFISYSRDDHSFVEQLMAGLHVGGFEPTIDRRDISAGEDWKKRLGKLLQDADSVIFVLSPSSATSEICAWEVDEARRLGKRVFPAVSRPIDDAVPPNTLSDLNYIYFYSETKNPGSGFGAGLARLVEALSTDIEWIREHTRLQQRALEWKAGDFTDSRLLSGSDIADAKNWLSRRPPLAPEPTQLHLDYISASEQAHDRRLDSERQRLEAMKAAQDAREVALKEAELAQKREAEASRRVVQRTLAGLVVAMVLAGVGGVAGVFAYLKGNEALESAARARERLYKTIATARNFATRTVEVAKKSEIQPEVVIELLKPIEKTLTDLADTSEQDPLLHNSIAQTSLDFGESYRLIGRRDIWRQRAVDAVERVRRQLAANPGHPELTRTLTDALLALADTYADKGDPASALAYLREASAILEAMANTNPHDTEIKRRLAGSFTLTANAAKLKDDFETARAYFEKALDIRRQIADAENESPDARLDVSISQIDVGSIYHENDQYDIALQNYRAARAIREALYGADQSNPTFRRYLSWGLSIEGELLQEERRFKEALVAHNRMLALREQNFAAVPTNKRFEQDLAWAHFSISEAYRLAGDLAAARASMAKAIAHFRALLATSPTDAGSRRRLGWSLRHLGYVLTLQKEFDPAKSALDEAESLLRVVTEELPDNLHWRFEYALCLSDMGFWHHLNGRLVDAAKFYDNSRKIFSEVPELRLVRANRRDARKDLSGRVEKLTADMTAQTGAQQ